MKKQLQKTFNMKKTVLLLLAFIGLCSFQMNGQVDGTFTTAGLWTDSGNWDAGTIASGAGVAIITESADINGDKSIGQIYFSGTVLKTLSSTTIGGTLTLLGTASSNTTDIINNNSNKLTTISCDVTMDPSANGLRFRNRGSTSAQLVFSDGFTLALGANALLIENATAVARPMTFNNDVTGTGSIDLITVSNNGGILLTADSDFTGYTGNYSSVNNPIVSNAPGVFLDSGATLTLDGTGTLTVNVANTIEGSISRSATTAGAAEVTFNANQSGLANLTVDTQALAIDFDAAATAVVFSGYTTSGTEGVVDLKNYVSGSLKIGTTATSVPSAVLETWTLDGAAAAITQDTDGSIIFAACTEAVDVTALAVSAETTTTIDLGWVNSACFDEVLVVAKSGSAVTVMPSGDGTNITADAAFGTAGTDTNLVANEFAVYKGTANTVSVTGLTTNTDYHFEVFTRKGTDWSDGFVINEIPNTFTTDTAGEWETGTNWVGDVAPSTATDNIIIGHAMTINSDVTINDLSRPSAGSVTVEPEHSLTINGTQAMGHQLFANSTATTFASLMLNGTMTQHIGYNLFIASNANGNQLISSPFAETLSKIMEVDTGDGADQIFNNSANGDATQLLFGVFNNVSGAFETSDSDNSFTTVVGTGYRAATISGSKIQFKNNPGAIANVDVDITHGAHGTYGQWNLIGNPYPTFLNFQDFFTANTAQFEASVNNAIYMWNGSSYTAYNNLNTTATSLISPGKGFFVKTIASTPGTVTFTPAMRKISSDGALVSKSANNSEKALAKINLTTATKTFATDIYFVQNQTRGLDVGYDAGAFAGSTNGIFTNLVEDNTGKGLLIQALPYDDYNNVVVPVSINAEAGTELTISLDVASLTLPENTYVYLKDNVLNTTTLLNDTDYVFTPDTALSGAGRFFIEFSAKAVLATDDFAVNEMLIYTNQATKSIMIKGILKADAT